MLLHDAAASGAGQHRQGPSTGLLHAPLPNLALRGAGSPAYARGVDIDGEPWASPPAMGADQPHPTTGPLRVWFDAEFSQVGSGYPVAFTALNTGPILRSVWDFGDGTTLTNAPFASHAWSAPGNYLVRLTGYNDDHPEGVTATLTVAVNSQVAHVDAAGTNPVFPYASWETAAMNIQEAIRAAVHPGSVVLVSNGVYRTGRVEASGPNRVALTNRVVVRSVNGPTVTVIEGEGQFDPETGGAEGVRCAYVGNGSVLSGFTLTKGVANWEGGWPWDQGDGVLSDWSGVVTECIITRNSATGRGGGAAGGTLYHCTLAGNIAPYGSGVSMIPGRDGGLSCALYHCTLIGNTSDEAGGAVYGGTLYNCIVYFNAGGNWLREEGWPRYTFAYSCTTPLPEGPGNIEADPRFMNPAVGDFRLRPDSPCIDAGTNVTELLATDILGLPRPLDGNLDGVARFDMGAYEYDPRADHPFITRAEATTEGLVLEWNEAGKGMKLQRATDLTQPDWQDLLGSEKTNRVTLPVWEGHEFFRLVRP